MNASSRNSVEYNSLNIYEAILARSYTASLTLAISLQLSVILSLSLAMAAGDLAEHESSAMPFETLIYLLVGCHSAEHAADLYAESIRDVATLTI